MTTWGHGRYGPTGGELIGQELDRYAASRFFRSDPMGDRGFKARLRYLADHRGGMAVLAGHGMTPRPRQITQWLSGKVRPRTSTREAVDTAYRQLRRHNIAQALRRRLADGRRITVEPLPPHAVPPDRQTRQGQFEDRETWVTGPTWGHFVDAWEDGDQEAMDEEWIDVCGDLGSPPEAYYEVSYVGFTI